MQPLQCKSRCAPHSDERFSCSDRSRLPPCFPQVRALNLAFQGPHKSLGGGLYMCLVHPITGVVLAYSQAAVTGANYGYTERSNTMIAVPRSACMPQGQARTAAACHAAQLYVSAVLHDATVQQHCFAAVRGIHSLVPLPAAPPNLMPLQLGAEGGGALDAA